MMNRVTVGDTIYHVLNRSYAETSSHNLKGGYFQ
ncbi:MAG: hypothetical protein ACI9BF_000290 [Candidatus Paceibacteria bacterium]|jgi:hypothetical protein